MLHYLKTGPILISLLFLTACAENGPSSAYLSPKLTPNIEINDSGESVVELLPLTPPPSKDPIVQRLEEEIRLSRMARAEVKLAELKDERMSFSDPKVTFKHDGTKEVSLDVNYQGSIEPIIFLSPKEHGKHFMFVKHSGFEKRNVTLQGMCLDDTPETCNELALEVAYYVNDLKVTEQFTVEKPALPAEDIEEEETPPLEENDAPAATTGAQDKAPELEFISETLKAPEADDESPTVDITTPQEDDPIHFTSPQELEEPAPHDELPHIDISSPEPTQEAPSQEPTTTPPVVMSESPKVPTAPTSEDVHDVKIPGTDEPVSLKQPVAISSPNQIDTFPIIDTTSHEAHKDVRPPAPNVMFVSPSLGAAPSIDNNPPNPVLSTPPTINAQPPSIVSTPPTRDTISPSVMSIPPERESPTLEDQTLTLDIPAVTEAPKIEEPSVLTHATAPDVVPDTPEEVPTVATETEDLVFTAATDTGTDLAPKTSPRPQARPDGLAPTTPSSPISLDVDGDSINVGAGRFVFPDLDGGAATTAFNVNSAEDYSLSLDATSENALLTEIQTTIFNQSERFYSRHRGRYGKIVNSAQLDSRIPGAGVNPGRRGKQYASGLMTKTLQYISETFGRRHPEAPICINDLSGRHGGRLGGHSSHQNGLDADISFPSTSNDCSGNPFKNWRALDGPDDTFRQKNWEFLNILINTERVNTIFADRDFVRALCRHAKKPSTGTTKAERNKIFRKLRHERGHANHYHIRMTCNSQNVGCVTQELPGNITNCD